MANLASNIRRYDIDWLRVILFATNSVPCGDWNLLDYIWRGGPNITNSTDEDREKLNGRG